MDDNRRQIAQGFDRLSSIYDAVVRFVFGSTLIELQKEALESSTPGLHVLVIGGGSGELLPFLSEKCLAESIAFVELSEKMRFKAKKRMGNNTRGLSFCANLSETNRSHYDLILMPFILDCYTPATISRMLEEVKGMLAKHGKLVITDFSTEQETGYKPSFIKEKFIALLYSFFRKFTGIEAKKLAPFDRLCKQAGLKMVSKHQRYEYWIQSTQWIDAKNDHAQA